MKNSYFLKDRFINIYKKASKSSEVTSQIIYGEKFKILAKKKDWVKLKTSFDNYIGFIKSKNFSNKHVPKYKVCSLKAEIFNNSNKKTKKFLPFGSKISVINKNKTYINFEKNKRLKLKDVKPINHKEKNFIKIFKLFLNTKYVWGGKTFKGIDCSAFVQLFSYYNGNYYPRDTKDQIKYLKASNKKNIFKKGDIIFWKGHVAVCINTKELIHAYGPEKKVLIMPILETIDRIKKTAKLEVKKIYPLIY